MSIRTILFEYGEHWNESFPELRVRTCAVHPATHRLGPIEFRVRVRVSKLDEIEEEN